MFPVESGALVFPGICVLWPLRLVAKQLKNGTYIEFKNCGQFVFLALGGWQTERGCYETHKKQVSDTFPP